MEDAGLSNLEKEVQLNPHEMIHEQVDKLYYDKKWEFNKKRLKLGGCIFFYRTGLFEKVHVYDIKNQQEKSSDAVCLG